MLSFFKSISGRIRIKTITINNKGGVGEDNNIIDNEWE